MSDVRSRFSWFGAALIAIGATMLLERLDVIDFGWGLVAWCVLAGFGGFKVADGFMRNARGSVFWGTVLLLVGLFNVLRYFDVIAFRSYLVFPMILIAVGLGFLLMYIISPKGWHVAILAGIFLGVGSVILIGELGYIDRWEVMHAVRSYWPVAPIVIGVSLLLRSRSA